jgi:hypothetical protein
MNGELAKPGEILPTRTPRRIGEIAMDIAELRAEASAGGYHYLTYFLGMALTEAEIQRDRAAKVAETRPPLLVLADAPAPSGGTGQGGSYDAGHHHQERCGAKSRNRARSEAAGLPGRF